MSQNHIVAIKAVAFMFILLGGVGWSRYTRWPLEKGEMKSCNNALNFKDIDHYTLSHLENDRSRDETKYRIFLDS